MARFSGTKSITPNGSSTLQGSGSVNVISTGSGVNIVSGTGTNITVGTNLNVIMANPSGLITVGASTNSVPGFLTVNAPANVGSFNNVNATAYDASGNLTLDNGSTVSLDQTLFSNTLERQAASAYFAGGVGIEQDLSVGGFIYGRIAAANTATTSSQIIVLSSNSATQYYLTFAQDLNTQGTILYGDNTSDYSPQGLRYQPDIGKVFTERLAVQNTENSTGTTSGAATVAGGVGIAKDLYVGGAVLPEAANTGTIGKPDYAWATAYLNNIYTKFIGNDSGNIAVSPNNGISDQRHGTGGIVDIFGDIRVRGNNPIGTAPVVTNVLYVTMDGDDTNDGRAMDPSRACRTISGAVKSPYYQPGTQIRVAPGHYLEDNPIQLKPYTSVMGSDLRTTGIEPINKTQDLFHMNSGCYLAFMQFLNGRSGLLPGAYAPGYNRGAYATAFPPLTGSDRIDLFHSPYIQNCTNLTGPWLQDGTMFVPDETVQVPIAVGVGSWEANTTTIVVRIPNEPINGYINAGIPDSNSTDYTGKLSDLVTQKGLIASVADLPTSPPPSNLDGYITVDTGDLWVYTGATSVQTGMSVDTGQQNQGFFNARTLLLANKPFMQAQAVAFIEQTFNSGSFNYNGNPINGPLICQRDTGLIIDAIALDMLYGSTSDSTFAGLQYWSQGSYTGNIASELTNTVAAITYLNTLVANIANSVGNGSVVTTVNTLFAKILNILNSGPAGVTDTIVSASFPTTDGAIVATYAALLEQKATIQQDIIDWITTTYPLFDYNTDTCYRDVGYIIDAVAFDLLHGSNLQSIKSGVYYYSFNANVTQVPNEIPQTAAAYNFIRSIIPNIVTNVKILGTYQTSAIQQTTDVDPTLVPGTSHEAATLQNNIDVITGIIRNGPEVAGTKTPQSLTISGNVEVTNAYRMLVANRDFIKAEVLAYIDQQFNHFTYNKQLSYRDSGILVENISYDAAFGGNQKAVESGLAYWNGVVSVIAGQTTQCISAIDYLNQLSQKIVRNEVCPVLPVPAGIPAADQVINTALTGGDIIIPAIKSLYNIVTDVIEKGPSAAPTSYNSTGPDAAFVSAEILMQANRKFIQEDTINWINNTFQTFPYNQIKCRRDTGLIIDSIAADLLYPTPTNSQVTFAGIQYWNQGQYVGQIPNEINQTIDAVTYLRDISVKVIQNITTATDALVGITRYSDGVQITAANAATTAEVSAITTYYNNVISILNGNTTGWTDLIVSNGAPSNLTSVQNAYELLQLNKSYLAGEVVAFVNATNPGFSYSTSTCYRDVGYIVDSISFDLLHGGNRQSIQAGFSYYGFENTGIVIPGETTATIDAFTFLGNLASNIVQNNTITPLQTKVAPVTNLPAGDSNTAALIVNAVSTLTNIIANGIGAVTALAPISLEASRDSSVQHAYAILEANRTFLVEETIAYINNQYNTTPFVYNELTCQRDTALIINGIATDLLYNSTSDSTFTGLQYWSTQPNNYTGRIGSEITTTTAAISYLESLVTGYAGTSAGAVGTLFSTIIDILNNGTAGVTDAIIPNGLPTTTPEIISAVNNIQSNKTDMQSQVVNYTLNALAFSNFNTSTCYRDAGYIIDSVCFDLLTNGNKQSIKAGVYYYTFTSGTAIPNEIPETSAAYDFIATLIPKIVTATPIESLFQKTSPQVTNLPAASVTEVEKLQDKIAIIVDIINNGPRVAGAKVPMNLTVDSNPNVLNAYNLLVANTDFIVVETIAFINATFTGNKSFNYNQELCFRDTGLIVDAVSQDILLGGNQRSIEAGLAYWNQGYNYVTGQESTTTMAINHARDIALKVIANTAVTPQRGTVSTQIINPFFQYGGDYMPQEAVRRNFDIITNIIANGPQAAPPVYAGGGLFALTGLNGADVRIAPTVTSVDSFTDYDETLCRRDSGYILDAIYFDAGLGTNYNSVTAGNAYRRSVSSVVINKEQPATKAAMNYLKANADAIMSPISDIAVSRANESFQDMLDIISGISPPALVFSNPTGGDPNLAAAKDQLVANRKFLQAETVAWIQSQINSSASPFVNFVYNSDTCARDVGFIVDALCYDILYIGNSATRVCAEAYFSQSGVSQIPGEGAQSVAAFNHMSSVAQDIIQGISVVPTAGNSVTQTVLGTSATGAEATTLGNLVQIITDVITAGNTLGLPSKTTPDVTWPDVAIQTAINTLAGEKSTLINNTISYINTEFAHTYVLGLSTSTIGHGHNATLYFGNTSVFPLQDAAVEKLSLQLTGGSSSWDSRKVDPIGGMGGSLVDGAVVSDRSPIQSFVYDAFTQLTQGGIGVHVTNNGYAQLVSVFTIFCSIAVIVDNGGIASITNSNCNFGDLSLVSKGYGKRNFSGTVFNPPFRAYPFSPGTDPNALDQYYPSGYWPNKGLMEVFVPDTANRPHIGQVMEVVPPETIFVSTGTNANTYVQYGTWTAYLNEQGLPGFLNAQPSTGTLVAGTIVLENISNTDVAIGNAVYIRDQFGSFFDPFPYVHDEFGNPILDGLGNTSTNAAFGIWYAATGTVVKDVGYNSITLNQALTSGGGFVDNPNYFTLYFCGNAYYTVQTSSVADSPYNLGANILSANANPNYQGPSTDQIAAHVDSIKFLNTLTDKVIANLTITPSVGNTAQQFISNAVAGGQEAQTFIDLRFKAITDIISAPTINAAETVVPPSAITQTGTIPSGAGSAVTLIQNNIDFLANEVYAYVSSNYNSLLGTSGYQYEKCRRDVGLILQQLIYDLESGGNYNSVYSGLSYWGRAGTHHIVELGEAVNRTDLFPDGCTVNFYQRSYISASGYLFEYVGAGSNYGALPQVGQADPVQSKETIQLDSGKVFFTSTDQNGDFRIGPGLVISQATGVLSGRTFTQSLFANMTPFILAIEGI